MVPRFTCLCLTVFLLGNAIAPAAEVRMDEPTRKATARALEWLASHQEKDGSWSDGNHPHNTALTSFALLAFLSQGHLPNQGLYGPEVARGCRFLLSSGRPDGFLIGSRGGRMYEHAMATLTLAELWGMTGDDEVKPVLQKAVDLMVRCQSRQGGWRYNPDGQDADISVTIMVVMALRAAKNSGLYVPDQTLKNAIRYINRCYEPRSGGFSYQPGQPPGVARTAAGTCVLQLTGEYTAKEIPKAIAYLQKHFNAQGGEHYWYSVYYAGHAMHQVGGKDWQAWYEKVRTALLQRQEADGSWHQPHSNLDAGPVYKTAIAVITLSIPADYLPIFQR
jgi:squalene cyclase